MRTRARIWHLSNTQELLSFVVTLLLFGCRGCCNAVRVVPGDASLKDAFADSSIPGGRSRSTKSSFSKTVHVDIPDSPDGHLVTSLPLLDTSVFTTKQWAGHLPASADGDKYFFYWLLEPDRTEETKDIPLLIWLNGGPGCSSMTGLFMENGPFKFTMDETTKEYRLTPDPHSWHKLPAYTLYIDQPVGTGLSFTTTSKYCSSDKELNVDFYYFLQQFLQFHRDKLVTKKNGIETMNRSLFISGESHAGHYNSIYTNYILQQNKNLQKGNIHIPIKGAAIGNGWVDPYYQYAGARTAYGLDLIGMAEVAAFDEKEMECQAFLDQHNYNVPLCFHLIDDITDMSHGVNSPVTVCKYDVRVTEVKGRSRRYPPGKDVVEKYLGNHHLHESTAGTMPDDIYTSVLEALHATAVSDMGQKYVECSSKPSHALSHLDGKGVVPDIVEILEHPDGVKLLFFNGMQDMVCNHASNEKSLDMLPWKHKADWNTAPRYAWTADSEPKGKISGYVREYENLKFLKLPDAGHMVPIDIPGIAFDMMRDFVHGDSFKGSEQKLSRSVPEACPTCEVCPSSEDGGADEMEPASPAVLVLFFTGLLCLVALFLRQQPAVEVADPSYDQLELPGSSYSDQQAPVISIS